jgi:3',5'-cyclic-AMP phosphodiesterase
MNNQHQPLVCVIPGDLHLTRPDFENHRAALAVVDEINEVIRPDLVQFIGDNVQDGTLEQFQLFRSVAERLCVPWHALVGDHDSHGDPHAERFSSCIGAPTGATSLRGFRLLRLNTQEARPVGLSPQQVTWFRRQLDDAISSDERVVIFQHNYPYQIWETFAGPGVDTWRELVQTNRVAAIVSGHTHYLQFANDGRNVVIATRSIGDPEGGPPGYLVLFLHGDDLAASFRAVTDRGPLVLVTHPRESLLATGPAHVVRGHDEFRVRVWSSEPIVEVTGQVDSGPAGHLEPVGRHDFVCDGPGALSKGEHRFRVRAVDSRGQAAEQEIEFAFDPTSRYTAVPAVRPAVKRTQFC